MFTTLKLFAAFPKVFTEFCYSWDPMNEETRTAAVHLCTERGGSEKDAKYSRHIHIGADNGITIDAMDLEIRNRRLQRKTPVGIAMERAWKCNNTNLNY